MSLPGPQSVPRSVPGSGPRHQSDANGYLSPVVDYEPPPIEIASPAAACPPPTSPLRHRHRTRAASPTGGVHARVHAHPAAEAPPPRAAAVFADAALRRILEVIDRRRPIGQLRSMLSIPLLDTVAALAAGRPDHRGAAVLRRVRLRTAAMADGQPVAAEVFGTYTRGERVRAIAARVERVSGTDRWELVALQMG
ncbi:putative alanine, arginine and proline rich protein [Mycolicibacterium thermoresistibile]|nr:putative alanine, arginine and proline rich protein [Mycolicibacterium thermoresistibile]